ncbi:MAG: aldehyde ferredoxin oxidoreductase family protein [Thermodesulfobacteriota bacterium]|jgi:aldehyde:ferredoxin oxidoreductase
MARGYIGKMLWVNLSNHKLKDEVLDEKLCRRFIGGYGLGANIVFSLQKAGVTPLDQDSILGILTGPLTGTAALGGSRYTVVGKSPLTGGWGDANSGGDFGPYLKFAGYDAVFFTGRSEKPIYLFINNGKAELRDAAHLWSKDCYETEDILKLELGKNVKVACIGPSGERLVLIASVINDRGRAAGRSGLGAVMGSKRLKAVAVKGNMKVSVAHEKRASDLRKKYLRELGGTIAWLGNHGTAFVAAGSAHSGDSPVKNWGGVGYSDLPDIESFAAENITSRRIRKYSCYRCPIGCGAHMKAGAGDYEYEEGSHRPEYETLAMFGSNCLNNNIESIMKLNDICNRYGIDTISAGSVIAFTIECYENKLITQADTGGIEMTWGNHQSIVEMTEKLAKREGFGDIIADGVKVAAERIGQGAGKYAMHIQGQELPAHDPKHDYHWGIPYMLDPTPARHTQNAEIFRPLGQVVQLDRKAYANEGMEYRIGSALHHIVNCSGMCAFVYSCLPNTSVLVEFMNAVTGWDLTLEELIKTGERILNMRQAFNIREGLNLTEFKIPDRLLGKPPFKEGPLAGVTINKDVWFKEYLAAIDWSSETAKPNRKKLQELGLEDLAQELWP